MSLRHTAVLFFSLGVLLFSPLAQANLTKIDPLLKIFAREKTGVASSSAAGIAKALSLDERGNLFVEGFVRVFVPEDAKKVAGRISDLGGNVRSIIGDIMTASIPLDSIGEISSWEEIRYIEAAKPLLPKLSTSIQTTNVDDVHNGTNLDKGYDGSGVIVGIVDDTRLDYGHKDFKDGNGNTRILFFWDKEASGSGVSEISGSSGLECTNLQIDAGTCTATSGGSTDSHSTHVTGIAAGSNSTFKGMAPGADIIAVFNVETDADSGGNLSTTIVDDVRYIFAKASSLKRPAVVNLSLGTSIGAHDGTSSMASSLSNLVGSHPGRAIANAAGNENFNPNDSGAATYNGIHATVDVASSTDEAFDFAVRSGSTLIALGREAIVDIWLNASSTCTVEIDAFDFGKTAVSINMSAASAGNSQTVTGSNVTLTLDFTDSTNANNGKKHAVGTVAFGSSVSASAMQNNFSFDLIFRGACTGDAWLWPDRTNTLSFTKRFGGTDRGFGYTYVNGDSNRTITIPATGEKIIAVGSFMSRSSWTDSDGTSHSQTATSGTDFTTLGATGGTVDDISLFSSLGPTPDSRTKPEIAAPGEPIVSSLSSSNSVSSGRIVDSTHFKNEGTSMSAPHVAGIIALMFQRNKCLTTEQVRDLLTNNTVTDSFTGTGASIPNNEWGYGKVDALATLQDVVTFTGNCGTTGDGGVPTTPVTTITGKASGGGCFNIAGEKTIPHWHFFILFFIFLIRKSRRFFKKSLPRLDIPPFIN